MWLEVAKGVERGQRERGIMLSIMMACEKFLTVHAKQGRCARINSDHCSLLHFRVPRNVKRSEDEGMG